MAGCGYKLEMDLKRWRRTSLPATVVLPLMVTLGFKLAMKHRCRQASGQSPIVTAKDKGIPVQQFWSHWSNYRYDFNSFVPNAAGHGSYDCNPQQTEDKGVCHDSNRVVAGTDGGR